MKTRILLLPLVLLLSCNLVFAEGVTSQYKLWRILDNTGQQRGYLLGSGYLPISAVKLRKLLPQLDKVFNEVTDVTVESCQVYPEIDGCAEAEQNIESLKFDCDKGLGTLLTDSELKLAREKLIVVYGEDSMEVQNIACLSPDFAMYNGTQSWDDVIMDSDIARYALWHHKEVHTLEKYELLKSSSQLPFSMQKQALKNWLENNHYHFKVAPFHDENSNMFEVKNCYLEGDYCHLPDFISKTGLLKTKFYHQRDTGVMQQRNHYWLPGILKLLSEKKKNTLFVTGLLHMYGTDSLVTLLQSEGYVIEPVVLVPKALGTAEISDLVVEELFWQSVKMSKPEFKPESREMTLRRDPYLLILLTPLFVLKGVTSFMVESLRSYRHSEITRNGI